MPERPRDPIVRTIPQPADMNGNGDIFGGWVLSQMDMAGGTLAARAAKGRVATVAITAMTFVQPIKVGDLGVDLRQRDQGSAGPRSPSRSRPWSSGGSIRRPSR